MKRRTKSHGRRERRERALARHEEQLEYYLRCHTTLKKEGKDTDYILVKIRRTEEVIENTKRNLA